MEIFKPLEKNQSSSGPVTRELTAEEEKKLTHQQLATSFKIKKLESEARKNWDKFYLRNKTNFFKDRNWSINDLKQLCGCLLLKDELVYLEAGCGVGNMLFPVCEEFGNFKVYAFDFSPRAIALLRERAASVNVNVETCVYDLTDINSQKPPHWPQADLTTLIFVLSAIDPSKHLQALCAMKHFVKIGGSVIVRDYGINDHAMLRFGRASKLGERFYARQDGTRAFYFIREEMDKLFEDAGFSAQKSEYIFRKTTNHQKQISVDRDCSKQFLTIRKSREGFYQCYGRRRIY